MVKKSDVIPAKSPQRSEGDASRDPGKLIHGVSESRISTCALRAPADSGMTNAVIHQAITLLRQGEVVIFPTETVYGIGADATNPEAVAKVFQLKGRPLHHPLIVHIADIAQLNDWAKDIPAYAHALAKQYWPGPMTLILKAADHVSRLITGGQDTIGIRMPAHPIAHELLKSFGKGVVAPSANRFGRVSSTTAEHAKAEFGAAVKLIIDGGPCELGIESTIIDCTQTHPRVLRPGPILLAQSIVQDKKDIPRVSGSLAKHYAPKTPVWILPLPMILQKIKLTKKIAVMSFGRIEINSNIDWRQMPNDPVSYAKKLYATLRELDQSGAEEILIEEIPQQKIWDAIRDRLARASHKE